MHWRRFSGLVISMLVYQLGRTFDAVLFDMDGTLVDSTRSVNAVWTRWAERVGVPARTVLAYCHGRPARSTIEHLTPHLDIDAECDWVLAAELIEPTPLTPIAGAAEFLSRIDVPWAVVTSADTILARRRLARAGLPVPEVLVGIDRVAQGKPEPDGYLAAAAMLAVRIDECLVFEDTPVGVSAARRAGMSVIGLATTHRAGALFADAVIDDYTSLLPASLREVAVTDDAADALRATA
jgi:sugar-phosphatase